MEEVYQVADATPQQTLKTTTVAVQSAKNGTSRDFNSALDVTGIAMAAIFAFMLIFFFIIKGIDHLFPPKPEEK